MLFDDPSSSSPTLGDARYAAPVARPPVVAEPRRRSEPDLPPRADAGWDPRRRAEPDLPPRADAASDPRGRSERDQPSRAEGGSDPRLIETAGAPEPEALRATTIASAVVRELYETGREVRFAFVPTRERVTVLLCDMDGAVLSRLTPARALEIATGEPIPGGRRR